MHPRPKPNDKLRNSRFRNPSTHHVPRRSRARTLVELHEGSRRGHVSLPNGLGLDVLSPGGEVQRHGVALNELTDYRWRDPIVGTPWHKYVPARIEPVG